MSTDVGLTVADGLDPDTLAMMVERRRVENEHRRDEIAELLQEADDRRKALVRGNRKDSARAFHRTDVAIRIDDLEFKVAAASRRAATASAEADRAERQAAASARQVAEIREHSGALEERLESLQAANAELRDRALQHQLSLNSVTAASGRAAHELHVQLQDVLHALAQCRQAIDRQRRAHAAIVGEAEREAEAHAEHAAAQLARVRTSEAAAETLARRVEDALADSVALERSRRDVTALEEELRCQLDAKDRNVALLHQSVNSARQAAAALKSQGDALHTAKCDLERDLDGVAQRLAVVAGRVDVVADALGDLRARSAVAGIAAPRASLVRLSDAAAAAYVRRLEGDDEGGGGGGGRGAGEAAGGRGAAEGGNDLAELEDEREQLTEAAAARRDALRQRVVEEQLALQRLERHNRKLDHARRQRTAEMELTQRRLSALDTSNAQLQEVADSLAARRDELHAATVRVETEGRGFARAAQEQLTGDDATGRGDDVTGGLVGQLRALVERRAECEAVVAALDQHRRAAALGGSGTPSGLADPTDGGLVTLGGDGGTGDDGGGGGGTGDGSNALSVRSPSPAAGRRVVVVAGGHKELLLQQMDDDRRAHALEKDGRGRRINELVYEADVCRVQDREAQRRLRELDHAAAELRRAAAAAQEEVTAVTADAMARRAGVSEQLLITAGEAEGAAASWDLAQHEALRLKAATLRLTEAALPEARAELSTATLQQKQLVAQLEAQVEVEMLTEDTHDALADRLDQQEAVLESFLAQIHQLSFEGDELAARLLQAQGAAAQSDVELQLAGAEFRALQAQRVAMQRQLRDMAGASTVARARVFEQVFALNQNLLLCHHRLKRLTLAVQVTLAGEQALAARCRTREAAQEAAAAARCEEVEAEREFGQELAAELVQRHGQLHALSRAGAGEAEDAKDLALEAEEARTRADKAHVVAQATEHARAARAADVRATEAGLEGRRRLADGRAKLADQLTEHDAVVGGVASTLQKDAAELQESVDRLKAQVQERAQTHAALLQKVCDVRYSIGRAGTLPSKEGVAAKESLESSRRAYQELLSLVHDVLRHQGRGPQAATGVRS